MKEIVVQIATEQGRKPAKGWLLPGMYRSNLCVSEVPNNGGRFSYGVTHTLTGFAVIGACTENKETMVKALKKLWKHLSKEEKMLFQLDNQADIESSPLIPWLSLAVRSVRDWLDHQIEKEVKAERV